LSLRRTPELSFELDRSAEQGARIDELLRQARSDSEH
jgi:ribosome-binding factor A